MVKTSPNMAGAAFHDINAEELTIIVNIKPIKSRAHVPEMVSEYIDSRFHLK